MKHLSILVVVAFMSASAGYFIGVRSRVGWALRVLNQKPPSFDPSTVPSEAELAALNDPRKRLEKAEAELAVVTSDAERGWRVGDAAMEAINAGDLSKGLRFAEEALHLSQGQRTSMPDCYHKANLALGRLALRRGNPSLAGQYLLEAANVPGSGPLVSFGPNMALAKELLDQGHPDSVLKYFEACDRFWEMGHAKLSTWSAAVRCGVVPDFGANLDY